MSGRFVAQQAWLLLPDKLTVPPTHVQFCVRDSLPITASRIDNSYWAYFRCSIILSMWRNYSEDQASMIAFVLLGDDSRCWNPAPLALPYVVNGREEVVIVTIESPGKTGEASNDRRLLSAEHPRPPRRGFRCRKVSTTSLDGVSLLALRSGR